MTSTPPARLTSETVRHGARRLSRRDPVLGSVFREFGPPPLWRRPQTLRTLLAIIAEQKISLRSARAVMRRLDRMCPRMTPRSFLTLSPGQLRGAGLSDAKAAYCRHAATAMVSGDLRLHALRRLDDQEVVARLQSIKGIGPWSANVYLTMALGRPDAWATGDRALAVSYAECWRLASVPDYRRLDEFAERWRPWRGVAARILWHAYLSRRR